MKKLIMLLILLTIPSFAEAESLKIRSIGESTSCGYYNGTEHINDLNASIPLMVEGAVESNGVACDLDNQAKSSTTVDWHLGRKDGDESQYEPALLSNPPATTYELAKSKSSVVTIQLGINDAVSVNYYEFCNDFSELVRNCIRTGKKVYIAMPNSIYDGNNGILASMTSAMLTIANSYGATAVNTSVQYVSMNDTYHPNPGPAGYEALGQALKSAVGQDAESVLNHLIATRYYIAMFNRTPEKGGLDYWAGELGIYTRGRVAQSIVNAVESSEGSMSDVEYIYRIYNNLMLRDPDSGGLAYWLGRIVQIGGLEARGTVMNEIIDVLVNGTATSGQSYIDQCSLQNRTSVGFAYGYI